MSNKSLLVLVIFVIVTATLAIGGSLALQRKTQPGNCDYRGPIHHVTIRDSRLLPAQTAGNRCDVLMITNDDAVTREIAFGPHDHHVPYDGVAEKILHQHQSLTVVMEQPGTFSYHDHLHDELVGSFTVR